jgi:hypothetical protein
MNQWIGISLVFLCPSVWGQRIIEERIALQKNHSIIMDFDFPELIKVYSSPTDELVIKGKISINRGEHDDAFELLVNKGPDKVQVTSRLKNKDKIPGRIVITRSDKEYYFKTDNYNDPAVKKFIDEDGGEYSYMNTGIIQEIELEVYIPKKTSTVIQAKYGMVEVVSCDFPLSIVATYAGADVTVPSQGIAQLSARTRYGEILTNLTQKPDVDKSNTGHDHWTEVTFNLGTGSVINVESKYGKVYLRKP